MYHALQFLRPRVCASSIGKQNRTRDFPLCLFLFVPIRPHQVIHYPSDVINNDIFLSDQCTLALVKTSALSC